MQVAVLVLKLRYYELGFSLFKLGGLQLQLNIVFLPEHTLVSGPKLFLLVGHGCLRFGCLERSHCIELLFDLFIGPDDVLN